MVKKNQIRDVIKSNSSGVYIWTNKLNLNNRYVGSSNNLNDRLMDYFNTNYNPKGKSTIAKAIKKNGLANFHLTIIVIYNAPSNAVITLEQYFLSYFPMKYNILRTAGTVLGRVVSPNEREYFMKKYGTKVFVYTKNKELLYQFYSIKDFCKNSNCSEITVKNYLDKDLYYRENLYITSVPFSINDFPTLTLDAYKKLMAEEKSLYNKGSRNPMFGRKFYGKKNPFFGKTHTTETKIIMYKAKGTPIFVYDTNMQLIHFFYFS